MSGTGGAAAAGTAGTGPLFPNPPAFQPPAGMLRRLTRAQFRNAVRDVFGVEVNIADLDADSWNGNFAVIGAATVVTSERGVEQYQTAIETAVNAVFADADQASPVHRLHAQRRDDRQLACAVSCRRWGFAPGAARWCRPSSTDSMGVAVEGATELGAAIEGARWATVALFISPNFLYRPELGATTRRRVASPDQLRDGVAPRRSWCGAACPTRCCSTRPRAECSDRRTGFEPRRRACSTRPPGARRSAPSPRSTCGSIASARRRKTRRCFRSTTPRCRRRWCATCAAPGRSIAFDDRTSALDLFSTTKVVVNSDLARLYGLDTTGLDVDDLPDALAARRRPAPGHPRQARLPVRVREPEGGLPHACAASSSVKRCCACPSRRPPATSTSSSKTRPRTCR